MLKTFLYVIIVLLSSCEKESKKDAPENFQSKVPEEFQQIANKMVSAWNNHDPHAVAELWAEDGNLITPWSHEFNGKKEIERHFVQEHSDTMKDSQIAMKVQNVRFIDPETAFVDADIWITGMTVGGEKAAPFNDHAIFLIVKKEGKWLVLIGRPY